MIVLVCIQRIQRLKYFKIYIYYIENWYNIVVNIIHLDFVVKAQRQRT